MKRFVFILALLLLLTSSILLAGCGKHSASYFTLTADPATCAPGDEVTVTVTLNDMENVACFDLKVKYDPDQLTLKQAEDGSAGDFMIMSNPREDYVYYYGMSATTYDFTSETIAVLVFTVNEGASGKIKVQAESPMFDVGTDDSGDELKDLAEEQTIVSSVTLRVAG